MIAQTQTPIIGVCAVYERARWSFWEQDAALVGGLYIAKVRSAGGLAIALIPDMAAVASPELLLSRIDGLLLLGGADVDPASYGAQRDSLCETTFPERDAFEIALASSALANDVPVLGICRGMQILNVAAGGTLYQDLNAAGYHEHRAAPGRLDETTMHEIEVAAATKAAQMAGVGFQRVNSHHHQGVDRVADGAVVTARSVTDGLPEALEWSACQYALGVQWHPESEHLAHAFHDFVRASGSRKAQV